MPFDATKLAETASQLKARKLDAEAAGVEDETFPVGRGAYEANSRRDGSGDLSSTFTIKSVGLQYDSRT